MSFDELKKLAEEGTPEAQYNLGLMYSLGKDVSKDDQAAIKWYQLAAEQGFAEAQTNLGLMYGKARVWSKISTRQLNGIALQRSRVWPKPSTISE